MRSAGITDLRYGNVLDEDWYDPDRFHRKPDSRHTVPSLEGVTCYAVSTTNSAEPSALANHLVGDSLVSLQSALGQHTDKRRHLAFAETVQWIGFRMKHGELLSSPDVTRQMVEWLTPTQA